MPRSSTRPSLEVDHLVGERDRRLAVGDHDAPSRRRRRVAQRRAGSRPPPPGRPREVASSRTSSRGRRTSARASDSRCRWPPDSVVPRSPSRVSSPSRQRGDEPVGLGQRAAPPRPRSSGDVGAPSVTLPRTVSSKRNACCGTSAACSASSPRARSRRSMPSSRTAPGVRVDQPDQQRGQRALAAAGRPDRRRRCGPARTAKRDVVAAPVGAVVVARTPTSLGRPRAARRPARRRRAGSVAVRHARRSRVEHRAAPGPSRRRCAGTRRAPSRSSGSGTPAMREQVGDADHVAGVGRAAAATRSTPTTQHGQRRRGSGSASSTGSKSAADAADRGCSRRAARSASAANRAGLLRLAAQRLDHQRAVERLVRDLADLGPQLLGPGHQRRHAALVEHVDDDDQREDQQADDGQHRVGERSARPTAMTSIDDHADGHRQRRDRCPGGLDVGVRVGQQLAGRVLLVPRQRQPEVLPGDPAAVRGLHPVLHDPGARAAGRRCRRP